MNNKCIICGKKLTGKALISFDNLPSSAQSLPDKEEIQSDFGISLDLQQCTGCGLVQFDCDPVSYYKDVIRAVGYSTTMLELRNKQYTNLIERYNLRGKKILEAGCARGEYLEILSKHPVKAYGIENNEEYVKIAKDKGLSVEHFFTDDENSIIPNGPFDAFLCFNFLEHQPKPNEMISCICNNLSDGGVGLITVPSMEYVLEKAGYYEFIRDHIAYYSFDTLKLLLDLNGFNVLEQEIINGDTLSVVVKKKARVDISEIKSSMADINNKLLGFVEKCKSMGKTVAIWGASHQAFTVSSVLHLEEYVSYYIDSADFKQGKYSPASHIPIISPDEAIKNPACAIIVMAPGYANEISKIIKTKFPPKTTIVVLKNKELNIIED